MTGLEVVLLVAVVVFGAVVGSFLNVVIYRLPRGAFLSAGMRSVCANPECGQQVRWHDNLPVLGWFLLRGRARCCGYALSPRYPLVEVLTAGLFAMLWLIPPYAPVVRGDAIDARAFVAFLFLAFFLANLVANTFIDIDHRILPDVLTKSALVVGLIGALAIPGLAGRLGIAGVSPALDSLLYSAVGATAGFALTQGVRLGARAVFRKDAMGYGDVKLMAAIGAFIGWEGVLLTFFLGCVLGAVGGLVHRSLTGDAYIYFGPFLAAGAVLSLFFQHDLLRGFAALQEWQATSPSAPWIALVTAFVCVFLLIVLVRRGRAS